MLSRLALRSGAFRAVAKPERLTAAAARCSSNQVQQWKEAEQYFGGPERDTKNFPVMKMPETSGKVRMGFIPDEWFTAFYDKTGVTGPYLFLGGLVTFLLSKEIWVVDHGFTEVLSFWTAVIVINKKYGAQIGEYLDKQAELYNERNFIKPVEEAKAKIQEGIKQADLAIWQEDGKKSLFQAKKENVALQLEAIYRERLHSVYQQVKKRLDYQVELQNTQRRFEQQHMVNWIVNNVIKGITPQQEKESMNKCIADLKGLAKTV